MREICETLGFNKSTFYYQPKINTSEDVLRAEIQRLAASGIRHTDIGASERCYCVKDTPWGINVWLG